jgi:hypothetical protein
MTDPTRAAAFAPAALLALGLAITGTVAGPAPAAQAVRGYRVCGVYNSARDGGYGTGLAVRIDKDDEDFATCAGKTDYMRRYYADAYPGSSAEVSFVMVTCEVFTARIGFDRGADICPRMTVNAIYRYTSSFDAVHPNRPGLTFWQD